MSTNNQNTNTENKKEQHFDEYRAYEELRMIFVIAIETQNFSTLEARISAWESKYPLEEFTDPEIIRRIKAILNKEFLTQLIGDYMAAKILHEQEKQKELYDSLKTIIDTAKKTKNYKTAQKEIKKWKSNLSESGFTLYSFDRFYRARICTLLLIPSKELENQEQATDELKKLKENGASMNSEDYFNAISDWQNKYSISDFPEKLQNELNEITTEVFDSISQKRTSENAISEIENILASEDIKLPANEIASILSKYDYSHFDDETNKKIQTLTADALSIQEAFLGEGIPGIDLSKMQEISPVEADALNSLANIIDKTPYNLDAILNWMYVNRKINYSEFARETIIKEFTKVGYEIPIQESFAIPKISPGLDYKNSSKLNAFRKDVIVNYLGLLSKGEKLTTIGKDNIIEAHTLSEIDVNESIIGDDVIEASTPTMFFEAFDTVIEQPEEENEEKYNENGELKLEQEEVIYNIFAEDIVEDPLVSYSLETPSKENIEEAENETEPTQEETSVNKVEAEPVQEEIIENKVESEPVQEKTPDVKIINEPGQQQITKFEVMPEPIQEEENKTEITVESVNEETNEAEIEAKPASEPILNEQDEQNLEKACELSTYVVVASPILVQSFSKKKERSRKMVKEIERIN